MHRISNIPCSKLLMTGVCQWLEAGRWFSSGIPVSSTNKTDRHDIAELLLKVALNTITLTLMTEGLLGLGASQTEAMTEGLLGLCASQT